MGTFLAVPMQGAYASRGHGNEGWTWKILAGSRGMAPSLLNCDQNH